MKKKFAFLLLFTVGVAIDQLRAATWTLVQVQERALSQSSLLKSSLKDHEAELHSARQMGRWDNPQIAVSYGPMTQGSLTGTSLDASVLMPIPVFGQKSLAEKLGMKRADSFSIAAEERRIEILREATRLAYQLAAIDKEAAHIEHRREALKAIARYLETRPHASPSQMVDKNLILVRMREIEEDFLRITSERGRLWAELNVYLELSSPVELEIDWEKLPDLPSKEELVRLVEERNPLLRRQNVEIEVALMEQEQTRRRVFPEFRFGASYNEQTAELPQKVQTGVIEMTIPVVNFFSDAKAASLARLEGERLRQEHLRRQIRAEMESAWAIFIANQNRLKIYNRKLLIESDRTTEVAESGWRKGLVSTVSFLELEQQMHLQLLKYYLSRSDYIQSVEKLLALAGGANRAR